MIRAPGVERIEAEESFGVGEGGFWKQTSYPLDPLLNFDQKLLEFCDCFLCLLFFCCVPSVA